MQFTNATVIVGAVIAVTFAQFALMVKLMRGTSNNNETNRGGL